VTLLSLIRAAGACNRPEFGRAAASDWLASWPGDLEVQLWLARAELEAGLSQAAGERSMRLLQIDPENAEAYEVAAGALEKQGEGLRGPVLRACAAILRGQPAAPEQAPAWAAPLAKAIKALSQGRADQAASEARQALAADPSLPLPAVVAMRAYLAIPDPAQAAAVAAAGGARWPQCLPFQLALAAEQYQSGESAQAIEQIHRAVAEDALGVLGRRYLGSQHPFVSLWPAELTAEMTHPVPPEVVVALGGALSQAHGVQKTPSRRSKTEAVLLEGDGRAAGASQRAAASGPSAVSEPPLIGAVEPPAGAGGIAPAEALEPDLPIEPEFSPEPWESFQGPDAAPETAPRSEVLLDVQQAFDRLAARLNAPLPDSERRTPAYVLLSSYTRLVQAFGEQQFKRIDEAMQSLTDSVRRRRGWVAYRIFVDDPRSMNSFQLAPCDPGNAWQIKLCLADLDQKLAQRGEMIGALAIVGGHGIIPFHLLPNPTEDDDDHVPSDNPYSTTDENYFAPEWPVGRFPAETDAELLISFLRTAAQAQRDAQQQAAPPGRLFTWTRDQMGRLLRLQPQSVGYSASIWRKASLAVFRSIGAPWALVTSPPAQAGAMPGLVSRPSRLSYFNLHGLEDAPEWFGQRDPMRDKRGQPEFPVALRPEDVVNGGRAPKVVFTEACYGAHVIGKSAADALSLKFLASGSHAVVGSTKISYGSVGTPLIAADLIGRLFWDQLNQGLPVGEALRRAKLSFATEMHQRQGFLDGEDQKTLIAFVQYGDPLYSPQAGASQRTAKIVGQRTRRPTEMKTTCALGGRDLLQSGDDPFAAERVRAIVSQYLPGMADAECHVRAQHAGCAEGDHHCPSQQLGIKLVSDGIAETTVVTFSKQVQDGARKHPHYARLTLDRGGKVLKLAVSR
jgi:tetratricopeptide (TPR) repeat protein